MVQIVEKDGVVFLYGDRFDLKIDTSRTIFVKKKSDSSFKSIGESIPEGTTVIEKQRYLKALYDRINNQLGNENL